MKKYLVFIILIFIIIILSVVKYKYGYKGDGSEFLPSPTMSPTTTPATTDEDYALWKQLPYSGKGFVIDRYIGPKELSIKIQGIDKKIAEKKIFEWLTEQNVATESYKLVFQ